VSTKSLIARGSIIVLTNPVSYAVIIGMGINQLPHGPHLIPKTTLSFTSAIAGSSSLRLLTRVRAVLLAVLALLIFAAIATANPTCSKCGGQLRISEQYLMGSYNRTWVIDHTRRAAQCQKCGAIEILELEDAPKDQKSA
jgi:hypothetical protein